MSMLVTNAHPPVRTRPDPRSAPRGWRWAKLVDLARLESGHTPSRRNPEYWEGGDVPWLSLKDIARVTGKRVMDTADKPTPLGIENSSARILPAGTVALCRTASVGKVAVLGREMATSQDFVNWVCGPELLPDYLYWAFRASELMFKGEKQGSTHKTIYVPTVQKFQLLVPSLDQQRRITDVLDRADAIRRKRQEAIRLTEELLRSVFLDMFGDPVTNPKGWPVTRLQDQLAEGLRYGTSQKCDAEAGPTKLPVLRIPNVVREEVAWEDLKYANLPRADQERLRLRPGDILFVRSNGNPEYIARCAVFDDDREAAFASYLIRGRLRDDADLCPLLVRDIVSFPSYRDRIVAEARTTAGNYNINTKALGRMRLIIPPPTLQAKYEAVVARQRRCLDYHLRQSREADMLFHSLMQRAFRGEL